ncbi:MAG: hypothetical protein CME65_15400 [Halobacteriovoraceae bacterium]|nr:hypothetical protein [Halobacteriovoraceae bacterium]|tara:strand:+ start:1880 stop:2491 length:612 start_codon:yes stop_codon:yes gene_type:complete
MNIVQDEFDKILDFYTSEKYYEELKAAKEAFVNRTGKIDEESDEYESRMNSFNHWYIFDYERKDGSRFIDKYLSSKPSEIAQSLSEINYSLFHFKKINFRKQIIINDVLHSERFSLAKENGHLPLVEDDLFLGRAVKFNEEWYLLNGIVTLPREVFSILKKESKKVRKLNNSSEELGFLLNLERLKNRSIQYGHVDSSKIFNF